MAIKGQIPVIEMITIIIILFVTFSLFFPETVYGNKWSEANLIINARDILITIDKIGLMNQFIGNNVELQDFIYNKLNLENNLIVSSYIEGSIKNEIIVACKCTDKLVGDLRLYINEFKINERDIRITFIKTELDSIQKSDVLLIWDDDRTLNLEIYENSLNDYINEGNGVILISDNSNLDKKKKKIFGIEWYDEGSVNTPISLILQPDITSPVYKFHKYFYNIPIEVRTRINDTNRPPIINSNIENCLDTPNEPFPRGTFSIEMNDIEFWTCSSNNGIYINPDPLNPNPNIILKELDDFTILGTNGKSFLLNYVEINKLSGRMFVSILDNSYSFNIQSNLNFRTTTASNFLFAESSFNISYITFNKIGKSSAIWIHEKFIEKNSENGILEESFTHDKRLLIASSIFTSSNFNPIQISQKKGVVVPYINIVNRDLFEIYTFNLDLSQPF